MSYDSFSPISMSIFKLTSSSRSNGENPLIHPIYRTRDDRRARKDERKGRGGIHGF